MISLSEEDMRKDLKYADLSEDEVEELVFQRLKEIKKILIEIRDLLHEAGGLG